MAAHQIIVHTSEIQNSGEVISLLQSSHNLQIQVKPELKVGFLISPRLGVNKVTHLDFFNEDRGQEIIEMAQVNLSLFVESNIHMTHIDFTNFLKMLR